jgi:hypothetical protein
MYLIKSSTATLAHYSKAMATVNAGKNKEWILKYLYLCDLHQVHVRKKETLKKLRFYRPTY